MEAGKSGGSLGYRVSLTLGWNNEEKKLCHNQTNKHTKTEKKKQGKKKKRQASKSVSHIYLFDTHVLGVAFNLDFSVGNIV